MASSLLAGKRTLRVLILNKNTVIIRAISHKCVHLAAPKGRSVAPPPPVGRQQCWLGGARLAVFRHRKRGQQVHCYRPHRKVMNPHHNQQEMKEHSWSPTSNNILNIYTSVIRRSTAASLSLKLSGRTQRSWKGNISQLLCLAVVSLLFMSAPCRLKVVGH